MVDFEQKDKYSVADLLRIMEILRAPDGCMWDRAQDHHSIRQNFIEETYEVCEAIDDEDTEHLKEELGDVLLQVVFHAQMEKEKGVFDMDDVADGICKKLIFRHPHIFGDVTVGSTDEILSNWDDLKRKEKSRRPTPRRSKAYPRACRASSVRRSSRKRPRRSALTGRMFPARSTRSRRSLLRSARRLAATATSRRRSATSSSR